MRGNPDKIKGKGFDKNPQNINRKGRPKMPDLSEAIAKILNEEKDGRSALDAILAALRMKAAKGDVRAAQELFDRGYGKASQLIINEDKNTLTGIDIKIITSEKSDD